MITHYVNFTDAIDTAIGQLLSQGVLIDTGRWQGVPTSGHPDLVTLELTDVSFRVMMHSPTVVGEQGLQMLREEIQPNLPWADDHFEERVSRIPSNPGEQYKNWPWWQDQDKQAMTLGGPREELIFTHTYQERFWPRYAGLDPDPLIGIRYEYGDLDDVVNMLVAEPYSRQAYFPIFFPEDTGVRHGGRVPCTLGYHFLLRGGFLHLWYDIRSCDAVRHFRDDLYLAARLVLWVLEEVKRGTKLHGVSYYDWEKVLPGVLTFNAHSFHVHQGDMHHLKR